MHPRPQRPSADGMTLALVLSAFAVLCLSACSRKQRDPSPAQRPGASVLQDSKTGGVSATVLNSMRWEDVTPTAETCLRHQLTDGVMECSTSLASGPCIYLRGLLELSRSQPDRAQAEWARLDLTTTPPDFLYAPWRLATNQGGDNRFAEPLAQAVKEGRTGPLVSARWHAARADWAKALENYLLTDPAQWSPHEVEQFRMIKWNRPTASDADQLLAAALRGGRVPKPLRADLARLIKETPKPDMAALAAALKADPALAAAATQAASRQLALRQAFASNRFQEVVNATRDADPTQATNETVLLAFLSASRLGERSLADRWAQELYRRQPTPEVAGWIAEIRNSKP